MNFKDIIQTDVNNTFINSEEFSEKHSINDKVMDCIIDNLELNKRKKLYSEHMDGVFSGRILIYVKAKEFGNPPSINQVIMLDDDMYTVAEFIDECGIYSIILEANMSG